MVPLVRLPSNTEALPPGLELEAGPVPWSHAVTPPEYPIAVRTLIEADYIYTEDTATGPGKDRSNSMRLPAYRSLVFVHRCAPSRKQRAFLREGRRMVAAAIESRSHWPPRIV
jgi:hypothetical protein